MTPLDSILVRFSECLWWINPKTLDENGAIKLDSVLIAHGPIDLDKLVTIPTIVRVSVKLK